MSSQLNFIHFAPDCSQFGIMLGFVMRIIAIGTLRTFWGKHPRAETPLRAWYAEACRANWPTSTAIKAVYRDASFIGNKRVIFNIKGNDYRLIVAVHYDKRRMFIRFVGTHSEYDKIDAATI